MHEAERMQHTEGQVFVLPTKPLSIVDAINRMCLATGSWRNAQCGSDADYNGHNVEVRFNDHRGYWVASYTWSGPHVIARGDLEHCLNEAASFYAGQGRGASVRVLARDEVDAAACTARGFIPSEAEDRSWHDWRFEQINYALDMERRGFGPYTHNLCVAESHDEFERLNRAGLRSAPIAAIAKAKAAA
jgi:hypothetical protein